MEGDANDRAEMRRQIGGEKSARPGREVGYGATGLGRGDSEVQVACEAQHI